MSDFTDMVEVAARSAVVWTLQLFRLTRPRMVGGDAGDMANTWRCSSNWGSSATEAISIFRRDRAAAYTSMLRPCRLRLRRL
jgi:hypothetical protein